MSLKGTQCHIQQYLVDMDMDIYSSVGTIRE